MTEGPRVNFVMREALFEIYTWILCLSYHPYIYTYQNCPVLAVKYPFLIHNRAVFRTATETAIRHTSREQFHGNLMSKFFLCLSQKKTLEV